MSQPCDLARHVEVMALHVHYSEPREFTPALVGEAWRKLTWREFLSFLRLRVWAFQTPDPVSLQIGEREFAIISRHSVKQVAMALEFAARKEKEGV